MASPRFIPGVSPKSPPCGPFPACTESGRKHTPEVRGGADGG
jgi:hypothetical protein